MTQVSTAIKTRAVHRGLTFGLDLGDRKTHFAMHRDGWSSGGTATTKGLLTEGQRRACPECNEGAFAS